MKYKWWVLGGLSVVIGVSGCKIYYTTNVISPSAHIPMRTETHTWSCPEWVVLNGEKLPLALMPYLGNNSCFYDEDGHTVSLPATGE